MKTYDGEKLIKAHKCLIYGGESETKGDALSKLTVGGCPKQDDGRDPKQTENRGMS